MLATCEDRRGCTADGHHLRLDGRRCDPRSVRISCQTSFTDMRLAKT